MAERFNAAVLKTVVGQTTGGSNPSLSARSSTYDSVSELSVFERRDLDDFGSSSRGGFARAMLPKSSTVTEGVERPFAVVSSWLTEPLVTSGLTGSAADAVPIVSVACF